MENTDVIEESVLFEVPNFSEYVQKHIIYDLHIHSSYSDGLMSPSVIVEKASEMGFGIAITDHNEIKGSIEAYQLQKVSVIPAIEVASQEGVDTLVYFEKPEQLIHYYEKCVEGHKGIDPCSFTDIHALDVLRMAKEYGGFTVMAHPFAPSWKSWEGILQQKGELVAQLIDGIECNNGAMAMFRNVKAYELAREWGKPVFGGSDAHIRTTLGDVITLIPRENADSSMEAFSSGKTKVVGRRSRSIPRNYGHFRMVLLHMRYWPSIVINKIMEPSNGR